VRRRRGAYPSADTGLPTDTNARPSPRQIFHVNFFRRGAPSENGKKGAFLWPGFGENLRVVDWMLKRCAEPTAASPIAEETPIGFVPAQGALDLAGLAASTTDAMAELTRVDAAASLAEARRGGAFLKTLGPRLPKELTREHLELVARLEAVADRELGARLDAAAAAERR
jgi:phosphoenolpyruvate carboxykinase (GTP)